MPADVVFLEKKEPLAWQVAEVLLRGENTLPIDLGDTQVWVPTAGAARRIRAALARLAATRGTGVLSPRFLQPMEALLPENPSRPLATRSEREAAWALVLRDAPPETLEALLPHPDRLQSAAAWLGVGGQFCDLCDLLVEGGHDPAAPEVAAVCGEDGARWEALAALYPGYLARLKSADRLDPNAARLANLSQPAPADAPRRVIVACIPDLSTAAGKYLANLGKNGVRVQWLVWRPGEMAAGWDGWGRPLKNEWSAASLKLVPAQIRVARQASDEAKLTFDYLTMADRPGDFALALADETLAATFATEVRQRGGVPFSPGGKKLVTSEAAVVALEWEKFRRAGELRVLRGLLQQPRFLRWMGTQTALGSSQLLTACDFLICTPLAETVEQAESFLTSLEPPKPRDLENPARSWATALLTSVKNISHLSFAEVLREAWSGAPDPVEREEVSQVLALDKELGASPLLTDWEEALDAAFARCMRTAMTFEAAPEGALELSGWLETPWIEAHRLAICGCIEGNLPTTVSGHAFLPDSKRALLGIQDNASRYARDAYLLSCLLTRHGGENLQVSFSKFGADGSPALPSRLLLQSPDLPERVLQVFAGGESLGIQPERKNRWRWKFPKGLLHGEIKKISPTDFKEYLACPFRFYWKKILRLDQSDPDPREMDARTYGLLVHSTLEALGHAAPDETDARLIEICVLEHFEIETTRLFGLQRAPAVRVQLESVKVRLRAFAEVQARERAAGWEILAVEKKFSADTDTPLKLGALAISAQIDRIERHPEHGLRIMDYKTFSTFQEPGKTHFGSPASNDFIAESQVTRNGKEKCWLDLQLPLYRYIAAQHYPDANIQTAYFVLPADPTETAIAPLDLTDEEYQSALNCGRAITERVAQGIFWPPQPVRGNWGDPCEALFLNGAPEECLDPATIEFLKGRP